MAKIVDDDDNSYPKIEDFRLSEDSTPRLDLSKSRYEDTFVGRYKHFFNITNPINLFHTDDQLWYAKDVVTRYKKGASFPELTEDDLWKQKQIFDSAFHPVTEEKMFFFGRMCCEGPVNMMLMGGMLAFYKHRWQVIFWQWANQSYNSIVNETNASDPDGRSMMSASFLKSYATAVGLAVTASLFLNGLVNKIGLAFGKRLVPFGATSVANAINIPLMREHEWKVGIPVWHDDHVVAHSKKYGKVAIAETVFSRIAIAFPHMIFIPILMNQLDKRGYIKKYPKYAVPFQFFSCGVLLFFSIPMGCAMFAQKDYVKVSDLDHDAQSEIKRNMPASTPNDLVYYNKGL